MSSNNKSRSLSWLNIGLVTASALGLSMTISATAGEPAAPRDVRLEVTDSGRYILSGQPIALADLRAKLRELKSSSGPINLHVTATPNVTYTDVARAMQIVQEEGLAKIGLVTVPPVESGSSAAGISR